MLEDGGLTIGAHLQDFLKSEKDITVSKFEPPP